MKLSPMALGTLFLACSFAQEVPPTDMGWPKTVTAGGGSVEIYQPQVDSWQGNQWEARSAITFSKDATAKPLFGIVNLSARTHVDKETRIVTLDKLAIDSVAFPSDAISAPDLLNSLRQTLDQWPHTISLDRLQASLAIAKAESQTESTPLKNDPPRVVFSTVPSVLIVIDGEPVYRGVPGTRFSRIINTPALILSDTSENRLYLDGRNRWMTASTLAGPWTQAGNPPPELDGIRMQLTSQEEEQQPTTADLAPAAAPQVFVSTTPAELIQTNGPPQMAPIARTKLLYATNSEDDLFLDVTSQQYYALLAGRWYRGAALTGPWQYVPGNALPHDFSAIPSDGPKAGVLASVPGTPQARDAAAELEIPQTAAVNRASAQLEVQYDGDPSFKPIEGTSLAYAVNTSSDVIRAGDRYYACSQAVWFTSDSPMGPWTVADSVPPEIYSIPPSSPLYHDRFVNIYDSTPDVVYVGYTPGYLGAYLSDGCVVFGTGWWYPGWVGGLYFGYPWTWGLGFRAGFWGGEWFFGAPLGYRWWYHDWRSAGRIYSYHWRPGWNGTGSTWFHNNVNVYNRWGNNAIARGRFQPRGVGGVANVRSSSGRDVYAGRDNQVYQRRDNQWYRQNGSNWDRQKQPSPDLNREYQSRSLGERRSTEFGRSPAINRGSSGGGTFRGGGFPSGGGFPRGGFGGGGFHGGGGRR